MPRIVREATVAWEGSLSRGSGIAHAGTDAFSLPVDLPSRVAERASRTSPEELLAAAHATCFATSVAGEIARAGGTVEHLDVHCVITMDEVEGAGHLIVASDLDVKARATGIEPAGLDGAVRAADDGCPLSSLIRVSASVSVTATLAS